MFFCRSTIFSQNFLQLKLLTYKWHIRTIRSFDKNFLKYPFLNFLCHLSSIVGCRCYSCCFKNLLFTIPCPCMVMLWMIGVFLFLFSLFIFYFLFRHCIVNLSNSLRFVSSCVHTLSRGYTSFVIKSQATCNLLIQKLRSNVKVNMVDYRGRLSELMVLFTNFGPKSSLRILLEFLTAKK